jgi:hypothetical protein
MMYGIMMMKEITYNGVSTLPLKDFIVWPYISDLPTDHQLLQQVIQFLRLALHLLLDLLMRKAGPIPNGVQDAIASVKGTLDWFVPYAPYALFALLALFNWVLQNPLVELALQLVLDGFGEMDGEFGGGDGTGDEETERV